MAEQRAPIIVLTGAHCGTALISRLLSAHAELACTTGSGVLPLCEQAAGTWRRVDHRDGSLSRIAVTAIRAHVSAMIAVILAQDGGQRWCDISFGSPTAAENFLQLYPGTQFICMHRNCLDVIRVAVAASPWGLANTSFAPFAAAYPGSSAAAVAAHWVERTGSMLSFEEAHPAACRRVRYEDLTGRHEKEAQDIFAFLNLAPGGAIRSGLPLAMDPASDGQGGFLADARIPFGYLPPPLTERVNKLQASLGYSPIG
jgi:protein-tyrosine sulfotransferase